MSETPAEYEAPDGVEEDESPETTEAPPEADTQDPDANQAPESVATTTQEDQK